MMYFTFNHETLEVCQKGQIAQKVAGQYLVPRYALEKQPLPEKEGFAVCVILDKNGKAVGTEYVPDFRGCRAYLKADPKKSYVIDKVGKIDKDYTLIEPTSIFDEFIKTKWVKNEQAEFESKVNNVVNVRRSLYADVDALMNEAKMIRLIEKDDEKADAHEKQAIELYKKIRNDNSF